MLNSKGSGAWQAITQRSNGSRESTLLLFNNVLIDLPNQGAWYHIKSQNVFAADWQNWLSLNSCWNISGDLYFARSWQLPLNLIYTRLMQVLRMLLDRPDKKSAIGRLTLEG